MKKIQILLLALVAVMVSDCVSFKTEATVDVEVTQKGKPMVGTTVYKFPEGRSALYKDNATGSAVTNAGGVAHFDLKSPDDMDPSNIAGQKFEGKATFVFAVFDANGDQRAAVSVDVKTGDKKTVKLDVPEGNVNN